MSTTETKNSQDPDSHLVTSLAFYGAYHSNKWNVIIHVICVPLIFFTSVVWLMYLPMWSSLPLPPEILQVLPSSIPSTFPLSLSTLAVSLYSVYYLTLEPIAGLAWIGSMGLPILIGAFLFRYVIPNAWMYALLLHIFGWYLQTAAKQIHPGHIVFEKRRPALVDSAFQSLVLAPFFVLFDVLFSLGYRPVLHKKLQAAVKALQAKWVVKAA